MKESISSVFFPVLLFLSLEAVPLSAQQPSLFQEMGAFSLMSSSDHRELPDPVGFGVHSSWEFADYLMARLSYYRVSDDTRKDGIVCDQYSQRINCRGEITQTSATLSGLRGALLFRVPLGDLVRLAAGGGLSFNHVNTESVGTVSNLEADLLAPAAGIIGLTGLVSAAVKPLRSVPLKFTAGIGKHWANFNTCSGNDPPQYDPYCGREGFTEIELGLAFTFQ